MIYFVVGASGSGKTAVIPALKKALPDCRFFDFDDIGVPDDADTKWRQEATERWLQTLMQDSKTPCCLLGQMVPGEILACPSTKMLTTIPIILLDCSDSVRVDRLKKDNRANNANQHMLNWSAWLRMHCLNPSWETHVITSKGSSIMEFDRWQSLSAWPEKAHIKTVDTTYRNINDVSSSIAAFINEKEKAKINFKSNSEIVLSTPTIDDMPVFLENVANSQCLHHPWVSPPSNKEDYKKYLERIGGNNQLGFLLRLKSTNEMVGVVNINEVVYGCFQSGYLGYYLFEGYQRRGLMATGINNVMQHAFHQLGLHRLEANIQPENHHSIDLVEKIGFICEGYSRRYLCIGEVWSDHRRFAITKDVFLGGEGVIP